MRRLMQHRWLVGIAAIALIAIVTLIIGRLNAEPTWTMTTVSRGSVTETVAVSGFVEAVDAADLSFPSTGLVTDVFVKAGDVVTAGQLLATLGSRQLVAERAAAAATLDEALAGRTELQAGPTEAERAVTSATVAAAEAALHETKQTESEKVANARAALLSNDLEATATDADEEATPPTISGSYACSAEGTYRLNIYRSAADSGYSYNIKGLESATGKVSTDQPTSLGTCGLFVQFLANMPYGDSEWVVTVPNTRSSTYTAHKNAFDIAMRQQVQNVRAAEDALAIAKNEATAANAAPRVESLIKANAMVQSAQAHIAAIDAKIVDASIAAPFAGTITNVDIVAGETANLEPVITMLGQTAFTLTARIPEIDVTKIVVGQHATVRFDASSEEVYTGTINFVSPLPTTIDGVAYFDASLTLDTIPTWIRAGLNADIDITLRTEADTIRIPERYLVHTPEGTTVLMPQGRTTAATPVTIKFIGNDGFAAVTGLTEGDTIVAPSR